MNHFTLNRISAGYLAVFALIVTGVAPRSVALVALAVLALWMLRAPLENGVLFFIRSVPLFLALPLTASYDNLNMWRPLALVLLLRFLMQSDTWQELSVAWHDFWSAPARWLKSHALLRRLMILLVIAGLSLLAAPSSGVGLIRIIYFANLLTVPAILWALLRRGSLPTRDAIHSVAWSTILVVIVGILQVASTYFMDIYQFMRLWGEGIQLRQFGSHWSYIAVYLGNTWFAYYGTQLSLRVFSLFTDSHTFPLYVLMGIPALLALSLGPVLTVAQRGVRVMARTRARMMILWVPLALLMTILSGTRGIWAASIGVSMLALLLMWVMKRTSTDAVRTATFRYLSLYLGVFILLFTVAWPIFISPQFLVSKGDFGILGSRVRSILDFGETSNAIRLAIWKSSLSSIAQHPLLGVGIGNFPVVLGQDIGLAKAGSTAHNVYLHVTAEMGIIAGLEFIIILGMLFRGAWQWFRSATGAEMVYAGASLLYLPWVYLYLLTDAALFDERAFLAFGCMAALIWSNAHPSQPTR